MLNGSSITAMLLAIVSFTSFAQGSSAANCQATVTSPPDRSVVTDNGSLVHIGLFAFTVEGTVSGLGSHELCIYQKTPGGAEWWRSGDAIRQEDIGPNGQWSLSFASCGKRLSPNSSCMLKVVAQDKCPPSGQTIRTLGNSFCASATYTFKTR